jgi:alpha-L-arabinofuranosidase
LVSDGPEGTLVVKVGGTPRPFDRLLLGTNAPAWIGSDKLGDAQFQQRIRDLGTTLVRMPGGSWSSSYDWLACENRDSNACQYSAGARPSDYVGFLAATGAAGMWTINFNGTAQQAAALVAFFNGSAADARVIGVDRNGVDWGTVGKWAALRASHGHPDPQPVKYWEIGNEVFGASAEHAPGCSPTGWEEVWTCDGDEYVKGNSQHDGYLQFRAAMRAVDPNISVGADGIGGDQSAWDWFGAKVIVDAGDAIDFYIVHDYGFYQDITADTALARPERWFPDVITTARAYLDDQVPTRTVPIAVTEYNLFTQASVDTTGKMSQAINALYIADYIGQMATVGVTIANQWNLVNGTVGSEGDYGMLDPTTSEPMPQFYGLALWRLFGDQMLPISTGFDPQTTLSAYAGVRADGTITLLVVNKSDTAQTASIDLDGSTATYTATADVVAAQTLTSTGITYNNSTTQPSDLASVPPLDLGPVDGHTLTHSFDPYSISMLLLTPTSATG